MNFGAFAGGFAQGMDTSMRIGKNIRDLIKEKKLQDLIEQGMAEAKAEAQRAKSVTDRIKEQGVQVAEAPTSGPVSNEQPAVSTPDAASAPVRTAPVETRELPPLGPKPPGVGASAEGNQGEAEAADAMVSKSAPSQPPVTPQSVTPQAAEPQAVTPQAGPVQATPQATAAMGVKGNIPGQSGFWVNGQRYDTREEARAAADKAAPSSMDFFMKNAVPKIAQQYMVNGDPATAKAWTDFAESHNGKRAIKDWAAAYSAPDFDTAVTRFGKYYTEHINDGVDYTGHKLLTKQDGTQVAVVTLKDKASGKTMEMEMTRERMLAMGAANNPQKLFETEQAKQTAAEKLKLEYGMKSLERAAKREDDIYMEGVKQGGQFKLEGFKQDRLDKREGIKAKSEMDKLGLKYELDAEFEQKYKKATSPTERRALVFAGLTKNNSKFSRMSKEEQSKLVDDAISVIEKGSDQATKPAAQPGIASKPISYNPQYKAVYQRGTGKPFHVVDGQYVPIEGAVPPQANGMPKK